MVITVDILFNNVTLLGSDHFLIAKLFFAICQFSPF